MLTIKLYPQCNLKATGRCGVGKEWEVVEQQGMHAENSGRDWGDREEEGNWGYNHHIKKEKSR